MKAIEAQFVGKYTLPESPDVAACEFAMTLMMPLTLYLSCLPQYLLAVVTAYHLLWPGIPSLLPPDGPGPLLGFS